jgi:translocation and assembly module TamB
MMNHVSIQTVKSRRWLIWLLAGVIALSAGIGWLLASTSGLHFLAATMVRSVTISGLNGTLLGQMGAKSLNISRPDLHITAQDIRLDWRPGALLKGRLEITTLAARNVEIISTSTSSPYPDNLRLPLALSVQKLNIDTLRIFSKQGGAADFSARNMTASLFSDGRLHRVADLHARLDFGQLTASGQLDGNQPFALKAQAELAGLTDFTGLAGKVAHISATVSGNLMKLAINASGRGAGLTGHTEMQLTPYAPSHIAALKLEVAGFNPRAFSLSAPQADLALQADLSGDAAGQLDGNVSAANLSPAPWNRDGLPLQDMRAHATVSPALLQLDNLTLTLAKNASIAGHLSWQRQEKTGSADLIIRQLDPAALDTRLRAAKLNGSIRLSGDTKAQLGVLSLNDGTLHLDAHLNKAGNTVTLDKLVLARGKATLTGNGRLQLDKKQAYQFNGRLQRFDLAAFIQAPHSDLNATLDVAGKLAPQPGGTLNFMMDNSHLAGQPVSGNGKVEFENMCLARIDSEFRLGDNRLHALGGLCKKILQVDLTAPALQQLGTGFGGELTAHASMAGSVARPQISFEASARNLQLPGEHQLTRIDAAGALHGEALNLSVSAANYRTHAKTLVESLQVDVQGSRTHHELNARVNLDKDNTLTLTAMGGFPDLIRDPANWQGALTELSGTGALPFKLLSVAPLLLDPKHLMLGTAELTVAGGKLHINGVDWTPQRLSSKGRFTGIGLRAGLLSQNATPGDVLRLGGDWNLDSATQGSLHIARERGDWVLPGDQPMPLGLHTLEFTARAASGRMTAELTAQGTRLGEWHAHLSTPFEKSATGYRVPDKAPLTGHISINISDLAWLGPMMSDNLKTAGKLALQADITGTYASPGLRGQVRGDNLAIAWLDQGVRLQQGQLMAHFDQKSLYLDTLNFIAPHDPRPKDTLLIGLSPDSGTGRFSATGVLDLDGKGGHIELLASHLPLSQRPDRWIIASGNGYVRLNNNQLNLGGTLTADAGLISQSASSRPQLSDDVVITGQQKAIRKGPHLFVDATLDLGEHFYLRASGLEARLAGQLNVRDEQGLKVTGSIAARDANFEAYGQKLTVQRGIVNFHGPLYDPGLNILAVRQGLSVEAGVAVTGTALHPVIKLVSTPDVPDVEKLSWIVLGRAPTSTGSDSALLLSAAGGILGGGAGGISGQLKQALGVDELSLGHDVSASAVNDNPLSSQIVTVGKRLSSRAFISYSQGVTAVAGITKLTYTLTPRVNIVTQAGMDNAIDIFYTFSFN